MNDEVNDAEGVIAAADRWLETATFADASDEQGSDIRAGRELGDVELSALFRLRHEATRCEAFIEGILSGQIAVVGQRADGEFLYGPA